MSVTNEDRYNLQTKANDLLGRKEGATLMELLPPVGWADVATRTDLEHLSVATKADVENLRVETKADIALLRMEFENLRVETRADIENLRVETKAEFAAVHDRITTTAAEIRAEIANRIKSSERWIVTAMFGFTALLGTVLGVLIRMS